MSFFADYLLAKAADKVLENPSVRRFIREGHEEANAKLNCMLNCWNHEKWKKAQAEYTRIYNRNRGWE